MGNIMNAKTKYYDIVDRESGELVSQSVSRLYAYQIAELLSANNRKDYVVEYEGRVVESFRNYFE